MIATLSELKQYLEIDNSDSDFALKLFLSSADGVVKKYIGREIESTEYTEIVNWEAQPFYVFEQYPVTTVTSVQFNEGTNDVPDWQNIDAENYYVDLGKGIIYFEYPMHRGFNKYKFVYTAWFAKEDIPTELKLCVLKLASKYWNNRDSDGIDSETVNGDTLNYDVGTIPSDIQDILESYREYNV